MAQAEGEGKSWDPESKSQEGSAPAPLGKGLPRLSTARASRKPWEPVAGTTQPQQTPSATASAPTPSSGPSPRRGPPGVHSRGLSHRPLPGVECWIEDPLGWEGGWWQGQQRLHKLAPPPRQSCASVSALKSINGSSVKARGLAAGGPEVREECQAQASHSVNQKLSFQGQEASADTSQP